VKSSKIHKEATKSGAGSSKARKYVYSDQLRFLSKLINERQTANSLLVDNMEDSQVTKLNKIEMLRIIFPKKLLSFYLIIKFFFKANTVITYLTTTANISAG